MEATAQVVCNGPQITINFTFTSRGLRPLSLSLPQGTPFVALAGGTGVVFLGGAVDVTLKPGESRRMAVAGVPLGNVSAGVYNPGIDQNLRPDYKIVREVLGKAANGQLRLPNPQAAMTAARYALLLRRQNATSLKEPMTRDLGPSGAEQLVALLSGKGASSSGSATPAEAVPSSLKPVTLFTTGNIARVYNRPTQPTVFSVKQAVVITTLQTYHWNDGRGAPGGTISLRGATGHVFGPWKVTTSEGSGAKSVYWTCQPNIALATGTYTVLDSDPATWSQNLESKGRGFVQLQGYRAKGRP